VDDLAPGERVGPYVLRGLLGRGAHSAVHLAEHADLGVKVALRVFPPDSTGSPWFLLQKGLYSRLAAFDHPNVVRVREVGESGGRGYVALTLARGPDLGFVLARRALDLDEVVGVVARVAEALDALRGEGIVHGDVKPSNILLDDAPVGSDVPVLLGDPDPAALGRNYGSRAADYLAPERFGGSLPTGASDVYSLGCVVFHCLSGRVPYPSEGPAELLHGHLAAPAPRLADAGVDSPHAAAVDEVVARAMAKYPRDRYESCRHLADALAAAAAPALAAASSWSAPPAPAAAAPDAEPSEWRTEPPADDWGPERTWAAEAGVEAGAAAGAEPGAEEEEASVEAEAEAGAEAEQEAEEEPGAEAGDVVPEPVAEPERERRAWFRRRREAAGPEAAVAAGSVGPEPWPDEWLPPPTLPPREPAPAPGPGPRFDDILWDPGPAPVEPVSPTVERAFEDFWAEAESRPQAPAVRGADLRERWAAANVEPARPVTGVGDLVDCTVFAPPRAVRGTTFSVQVYVHLLDHALAGGPPGGGGGPAVKSLATPVPRGSILHFDLSIAPLAVEDGVEWRVWRSRPEVVQFSVRVPSGVPLGPVEGTLAVSQSSVPIGHVRFQVSVSAEGQGVDDAPDPEPTGSDARRYRTAFVSYARVDRRAALERLQMLPAVGISLVDESGAEELAEEVRLPMIDDCDLFLLFWSRAARESERMRREVRYALERQVTGGQGRPEIRPVIIEGPPVAPPWDELTHLPFGERLLYVLAGTA
jgi:hypothetical protein